MFGKPNPNHNCFHFLQFLLILTSRLKAQCVRVSKHIILTFIFFSGQIIYLVSFIIYFSVLDAFFLLVLSHLRITFQFRCTMTIKTFSSVKFIYSLVSMALMTQNLQLSHNKPQPGDTNCVEVLNISEKTQVVCF